MSEAEARDAILASIVFPLADLRALLAPAALIDAPFLAKDSRAHLRRFGHGMYRVRARSNCASVPEVLDADEAWFLSARRLLHVPDAPIAPRLFADGFISARLDVTIVPPWPQQGEAAASWVKRLLNRNVRLRSSRSGKRSPDRRWVRLSDMHGHFRSAYVSATTPEPQRQAARDAANAEAAQAAEQARRYVCELEPILLFQMPPRCARSEGLALHAGIVGTQGASFRMLVLYADEAADPALIRLARRSFIRLHAEGRAIQKLTQLWSVAKDVPPLKPATVRRLDAIADRLTDVSSALADGKGAPIPLLGELAPMIAEAAERLGSLLDDANPGSGGNHRRLARQIVRAAPPGAEVNINFGIVGQQGSMGGGIVVQTVTRSGEMAA